MLVINYYNMAVNSMHFLILRGSGQKTYKELENRSLWI